MKSHVLAINPRHLSTFPLSGSQSALRRGRAEQPPLQPDHCPEPGRGAPVLPVSDALPRNLQVLTLTQLALHLSCMD